MTDVASEVVRRRAAAAHVAAAVEVGDRDEAAEGIVGRAGRLQADGSGGGARGEVVAVDGAGHALIGAVAGGVVGVGRGENVVAGAGIVDDLRKFAGVEIGIADARARQARHRDELAGGVVAVVEGVAAEVAAVDGAPEIIEFLGRREGGRIDRRLDPAAERAEARRGDAPAPGVGIAGCGAGEVGLEDHASGLIVVGPLDRADVDAAGMPYPLAEPVIGIAVGQQAAAMGDGEQPVHRVVGARFHTAQFVDQRPSVAEHVVLGLDDAAVGMKFLEHRRVGALIAGAGEEGAGGELEIGVARADAAA